MNFELKGDFIELNKLLKLIGVAESGGTANFMIANKEVSCNGLLESRKRLKLKKGDLVQIGDVEIKIV